MTDSDLLGVCLLVLAALLFIPRPPRGPGSRHPVTRFIVLLFVLAVGCGKLPVVSESPPPYVADAGADFAVVDPFAHCFAYEVDFVVSSIPWTPAPVPFRGARVADASASVPVWWAPPEGATIHLSALAWDAAWVRAASLEIPASGYVFASWWGAAWTVDPYFDVRPYLALDEGRDQLVLEMRIRASGIKPAGDVEIESIVDLYVCEVAVEPPREADEVAPLLPGDEADLGVPAVELPTGTTGCGQGGC